MYSKFAELLQKRGITAYRVAKDTGLTPVLFSDWKAGRYTPKIDKIIILARYFDVPIEYFLENEKEAG